MLSLIIGITLIIFVEGIVVYISYKRKKRQKKVGGLLKESELYRELSEKYDEHKGELDDAFYEQYVEIIQTKELSIIRNAKGVIMRELENTTIFTVVVAALQVVALAVAKLTSYSMIYSLEDSTWNTEIDLLNVRVDIVFHCIEVIILAYIIFAALMPAMKFSGKQRYFLEMINDVLNDKRNSIEKKNLEEPIIIHRELQNKTKKNVYSLKYKDEQLQVKVKSEEPINELHIRLE